MGEKLNRLSGEDFLVASQVLEAAALLLLPEVTKSKFFINKIDEIQKLRNEGFSWIQIQTLFAKVGIKLSASTLRSYYSRAASKRELKCQRKK